MRRGHEMAAAAQMLTDLGVAPIMATASEHLHERLAYDLDYINHWSLWFDIRIILKTLLVAFGQRHAY